MYTALSFIAFVRCIYLFIFFSLFIFISLAPILFFYFWMLRWTHGCFPDFSLLLGFFSSFSVGYRSADQTQCASLLKSWINVSWFFFFTFCFLRIFLVGAVGRLAATDCKTCRNDFVAVINKWFEKNLPDAFFLFFYGQQDAEEELKWEKTNTSFQ